MEYGRVPPHSKEAEQSVLGSMLLSPAAMGIAVMKLQNHDFYYPSHQVMFEAMCKLYGMGKPVDLVTLCDMLQKNGSLEGVGGAAAVSQLVTETFTTQNVDSHIEIIKDRSLLRRLGQAGGEIADSAYDVKTSSVDVLSSAEKKIFDIAKHGQSSQLMQIQPVVYNVYEEINAQFENQGKLPGLTTGFRDLDHMLSGLHAGQLLIVAARPGMGKTSFMLNILSSVAKKTDSAVAFFSLEMSREQLVTRLLSTASGVSMTAMRKGALDEHSWPKITQGMQDLAPLPIFLDDTPSTSPMEVLSKCRHLAMHQPLGLVIIDYLQLMRGNTKTDNRVAEISEISRDLKALARELGLPVIAASQLSRSPDKRNEKEGGHRPQLSDLRESGSIEQDADVVMFLYRENIYNPEASPNEAEIIVAKQRSGPTGRIPMHWTPELTLFSDAAHAWRQED